jgi:P-type conjugative transfer protein TrbJ
MLRRHLLLAASIAPFSALGLLAPRRAAAFPVTDSAGIGQVVAQIGWALAQIAQVKSQVDYLRNAARTLDPRSYRTIGALLDGDPVTLGAITRDVDTIGYTLDSVNRRFNRLFPDEAAVRNMRPAEHAETSRQMNRELHGSALVAYRAQSNLSTVEANHAQAKAILQRSDADDSQVAQIQSAIQMLALVHDNLTNITQTVATAGRVSSDIAAAGVTDNRIAAERRRQQIEGFNRPVTSPGLDPSFLRD